MAEQYENLIAGSWSAGSSGQWFDDLNPADTRETVASFPSMNEADATTAIESAAKAFREWADATPVARSMVLRTAAELFRQQTDRIARDITREMGKTLKEATAEVQATANFFEYYSSFGRHPIGNLLPDSRPSVQTSSTREPVGVVVAITPWNDPLLTPARKLAPALIAGNSVVIKPATVTPLAAWHVTRVLNEAGLPAGVINMITGSVRHVSKPLLHHPAVKAVTFTGSTEVGFGLARELSERNVRLQTEMGGKNAVIVLNDANLDLTVEAIMAGAFAQAGQRCTATSRVVAQSGVADALKEQLSARAQALKVGPGLRDDTQMGPLVDESQLESVLAFVDRAREEGAAVACGGERVSDGDNAHGYFVRPTIFANIKQDMAVWQEEIFGPAVSILSVDTFDEAIHTANASRYGLSASIFTDSLTAAHTFARRIDAGNVSINLPTAGWDVHIPFGGFKDSGSSFKEQGIEGLQFYTRIKSIAMRTQA